MPTNEERLKQLLMKHEGLRLLPYYDSVGKLSIGWGRNLADRGISRKVAEIMLWEDISEATTHARQFPFFSLLSPVRQAVIVEMIFNMGIARLRGFKKMLAALTMQNWEEASKQMLDSKWAAQVGQRARTLATMMKTNQWPAEVRG